METIESKDRGESQAAIPSVEPDAPAPVPDSLKGVDPEYIKVIGWYEDDVEGWFHAPNPVFEMKRPIDLIGTPEEERLRNRVGMVKYGQYS